jgi:hypothetical protein
MLRITADLKHAVTELRKRRRQVGRGRRLADPALAVDGEDLGSLDLVTRVELNLDRAFPVGRGEA